MEYRVVGSFSYNCTFLELSSDKIGSLDIGVTNEEVRKTVFGMAPLKAPGIDGFQAKFFSHSGVLLNHLFVHLSGIVWKECTLTQF